MARQSEIIEIQDGERLLSFRIQKMNPLDAEDFLERMFAALVKAGFKVPAKLIGGDPSALGKEIAKNAEGFLVQLKDLHFDEVAYLRGRLFKECWFRSLDERSGREVEIPLSDNVVNNNIEEVSTIFKLRLAVLRYNFGFLADALGSVGKEAARHLSKQNTPTSVHSSEHSYPTESGDGSSGNTIPTKKPVTNLK